MRTKSNIQIIKEQIEARNGYIEGFQQAIDEYLDKDGIDQAFFALTSKGLCAGNYVEDDEVSVYYKQEGPVYVNLTELLNVLYDKYLPYVDEGDENHRVAIGIYDNRKPEYYIMVGVDSINPIGDNAGKLWYNTTQQCYLR